MSQGNKTVVHLLSVVIFFVLGAMSTILAINYLEVPKELIYFQSQQYEHDDEHKEHAENGEHKGHAKHKEQDEHDEHDGLVNLSQEELDEFGIKSAIAQAGKLVTFLDLTGK